MKVVKAETQTTNAGKTINIILQDENGVNQNHVYQEGTIKYGQLETILQKYADKQATQQDIINAVTQTVTEDVERHITENHLLDGRMTVEYGKILIDGNPIEKVLEEHIIELLKQDENGGWQNFSKFLTNLFDNTNPQVRQQLYCWLNAQQEDYSGLELTEDGCFIGWKGCTGTKENPLSQFAGYGIVDGQTYENAQLPNKVGSTIKMPHDKVEQNPDIACAEGLHVGTHRYAKQFAETVLLKVKVNPKNVAAVPSEEIGKLRCYEYEVLDAQWVEKK